MDPATAERSSLDDVIDSFKKDVDFTLIEENLKLTTEQRLLKLDAFREFVEDLQEAGRRSRGES